MSSTNQAQSSEIEDIEEYLFVPSKMNRRRAISIFIGSRTCDWLPNMQRKMTVVDIQRFKKAPPARSQKGKGQRG